MMVTKVAAAALQKLLHKRMTLNNLSVSSRSFEARIAPRLPFLARCFNLKRLTDIKLVSDREKKADIISKLASKIN